MSNMAEKDGTQRHDFVSQSSDHARVADDASMSKADSEKLDDVELGPKATYINTGAAAGLPQEHRDYLLARHGTLDLDPVPDMGDQDPYNWPTWKKTTNLVLVALGAMVATMNAAAIIPAYEDLSEALGVSLQRTSYLTSLQIAILGGGPLFWKPISNRYGRRPVWFISFLCACLFNVGCALSTSYAAMATCRAFVAFFQSPPGAIGTGVVTESFFKKERGKYVGVWAMLVTLGVPVGPFLFGFVTYRVGYVWIYWALAICSGVQFILAIFLMPETRYIRQGVQHYGSAFKQEYMQFRCIDPTPFSAYEFIQPLSLFKYPSVAIPIVAYAMVFLFASVMTTVEIPQLFLPKFGLNPQEIGLQFLGIIIGTIIGEQLGGALSDYWMKRHGRQINAAPAPEYRLWLSYGGFALTICGLVVFLVQTAHATHGHWNVTPIVGVGIAAAGNQIVTTVLVTYAIDSHPEQSNNIGVFVNVVRQTWGFLGPFWLPDMFATVGTAGSAGVVVAMIIGVSVIPTIYLHCRGERWRDAKRARHEARGQ
ncbi:hypothetical protein AAFC00_000518 [Neodothiora populina]|uniref:Major facilitator superfamily (MFS) profile domain-containing protein n=1 Tax=Neodothiora populina TaxID=2781224 RepID=A0ABR3PD55_9PEZI